MSIPLVTVFTGQELSAITAALRIAADAYTADAAVMAANAQPGLERQFKRQACDARMLADRIEEEG